MSSMMDHNRQDGQRMTPEGYRRLDEVPWSDRVEARHLLQMWWQNLRQLREDLAVSRFNADGAVAEVDRAIADLKGVRRLLGGKLRVFMSFYLTKSHSAAYHLTLFHAER